jgi:type I restriction enzyme, S subunit
VTKEQNNLPVLPENWVWCPLPRCVFFQEGPGLRRWQWTTSGMKVINVTNILPNNSIDITNTKRYISIDEFEKRYNHFAIENGDIVVASSGASYGKVGRIRKKHLPLMMNTSVIRFHPLYHDLLDSNFLYTFLLSNFFRNQVESFITGSAQPNFGPTHLKKMLIPIPPLAEQRRIASKVEELFTKLDAGVSSIQNVKTQLQLYRQTVLKHAFTGKLTEEWRKTQKNSIQPATIELKQLQKERKGLKGRYAPVLIDSQKLNEIPDTWVWTSIGQISEKIQYGTSEKATDDTSGIPVLRMGNIQDGQLVYDSLKYYPQEWESLNDFLLVDGDVLFNRLELVGKTAVYKKNYPKSVFASYLIRIKVNVDVCLPDILSFYINSVFGRQYISSVVSQQVGQANVNGKKLSAMQFPLIPLPEQEAIIELIEEINSIIEQTQNTIEQTLRMSEKLRYTILKTAFEGKLVAHESSDESVERLLEMIKLEKPNLNRKKTNPMTKMEKRIKKGV